MHLTVHHLLFMTFISAPLSDHKDFRENQEFYLKLIKSHYLSQWKEKWAELCTKVLLMVQVLHLFCKCFIETDFILQ